MWPRKAARTSARPPAPAPGGTPWRAGVHVLLAGTAFVLGELIVYRLVIFPRLPPGAALPLWAWPAMYAPLAGVLLWAGARLRSRREAVVTAVLLGLFSQTCKWTFAALALEGYGQSLALRQPLRFWTVLLASETFGYLVLLGVGAGLAAFRRRG